MKDIVMDQRSVYKGNLILVNRDNPIRERLAESDLVPVSQNDQGILLCGCLLYTSPSPRD